jgi:myosin regulatory light chain 12
MAEEGRKSKNVLGMFPQAQIQEFKEAFTMIDQNRDGFIDVEDLKDMYASLGQEPKTDTLKAMLKECPGQLNFTAFLTLFGEKAHGTDPESTIMNAFQMFDDDNKGMLDEEYVKDLLQNVGDIFTKDEMKQTWKEAPVSGGKFDYKQMVKLLKGQGQDEAA